MVSTVTVAIQATAYQNRAREALAKINSLRKSEGLAALKMPSELEKAALTRAAELFVHFDHKRPDMTDYDTVSDAYPAIKNPLTETEIILAGYSRAADMFSELADEKENRAAILGEEYTHIGVGCVYVPGSYNEYYWAVCLQGHRALKAASAPGKASAGVKKTFNIEIKGTMFPKADSTHGGFLLKADGALLKGSAKVKPDIRLYDKKGVDIGRCDASSLTLKSSDTGVCAVQKDGSLVKKGAGECTVSVKAAGLAAIKLPVKAGTEAQIAASKLSGVKPELVLKEYSKYVSLSVYEKGASGYVLYRASSAGGAYRKADEKAATSRWTLKITKSASPKKYYYKARAYKNAGGKRTYSQYCAPVKVVF